MKKVNIYYNVINNLSKMTQIELNFFRFNIPPKKGKKGFESYEMVKVGKKGLNRISLVQKKFEFA